MDLDELTERDAGDGNNVSDSNIFIYVMLTLVFLLSVLAIVIAIVAYVKATGQLIGPDGPQGPEGEIPVAQLFEQPAFYVSALNYVVPVDPLLAPRFLVFTGDTGDPNIPIDVTMPQASKFSGKIFRIYNVQNQGGVRLLPATGDSAPVPFVFNPVGVGLFCMAISDGASLFALNSSTVIVTMGTGP